MTVAELVQFPAETVQQWLGIFDALLEATTLRED